MQRDGLLIKMHETFEHVSFDSNLVLHTPYFLSDCIVDINFKYVITEFLPKKIRREIYLSVNQGAKRE